MKNIFTIILAFISLSIINAQQKKVLFIGNSYTGYNNLPLLTFNVAQSTGNEFVYDSHTPGGQRFLNHAVNAVAETKINSQDWDYVILQGQSVEVSLTGNVFDVEVAPYVAQLCDKIRANNSCSQPVFYRTWGRENGFNDCVDYPWICTYEGMDDALAQNYQILANSNDALVSPVGAVWRYLRENHPELDLYSGDGSHPSQTGSYVAACTFYTTFFRNDPTLITYNYNESDADADMIKSAVKTVVYDNLTQWNIGNYDADSSFLFAENNDVISFTNTSVNAETYAWDFGDGNTSTDENPNHSYALTGTYQVSLTVTNCGVSSTFTEMIIVASLSVEASSIPNVAIYPNPIASKLYFKGIAYEDIESLVIYDLLGKEIKKLSKLESDFIEVSELPSGTYFLKITKNGASVLKQIVKE